MIKLENIQAVNYVETTVEWEQQWAVIITTKPIMTLNNTDLSLTFHYWVFLWLWRSVILIFLSKLKYWILK